MKKYNIYTEGNYFTIKSEQGEFFYGHRKDVVVDKDNINLQNYRIFNVKDFSDKIIVKIPNILKQDDSPYTLLEWETFYKENTGNFNGGGSAPTVNQNNKTSVIRIYDPIYDLTLLTPSQILAAINNLNLVVDEFTTPIFQFYNDSQATANWVSNFGKGNTNAYALTDIVLLNGTKLDVLRITRAEAVFLQQNNSFIVGLNYVITDADVNLYGGTEVTLLAITKSKLSLQGSGLFYTPKYDENTPGKSIWTTYMEGTFSNVSGVFTNGESVTVKGAKGNYLTNGLIEFIDGNWVTATNITGTNLGATATINGFVPPSYSDSQLAHWGGKTWQNKGSIVGLSVDKYNLDSNWSVLPFSDTDYNVSVDEIHYDFNNDLIIYRRDKNNNFISYEPSQLNVFPGNPIKDFQWGSNCKLNKVNDSYLDCLNTLGVYYSNELNSESYINDNILSTYSGISNNYLTQSTISSNVLVVS